MLKYFSATLQTTDAKQKDTRRFRNILAASGKILESGEIRDIENLFVMGVDGKLIRIKDLATDPDKQSEQYKLNFADSHGHFDEATGERIVSPEDIIGDAKVWMEDDGIHARVYFANNDPKADHDYAISDNASYSAGAEWFPDGYYGAENSIDEPIGILREISIVDTGNDPRARTIDTKTSKGATGAAGGDKNNQTKKGNIMPGTKKSVDALTPDERAAMMRKISEAVDEVIDDFTTNAPESETQPTAKDEKEEAEDKTADNTEENKEDKTTKTDGTTDAVHSPVVVIRDRVAHQEQDAKKTTDWRFSAAAKRKFADMLYENGGTGGSFASDWTKEVKKHGGSTHDGITGLNLPTDGDKLFINAIEKSDGLLQHVNIQNRKNLPIDLLSALGADTGAETARAHGFKKGDEKIFQELVANGRQVYTKMIYKMLDLDATEIYENPELVEVRAQELVESLIVEYERSFTIGDGRTAPTGENPDLRTFDGTRGFYSIVADAAATAGSDEVGQFFAKAITLPSTSTLLDASIEAESEIDADGGLIYVVKKEVLKNFRKAKDADGRLIVPLGVSMEDALQAKRVYAPSWMKYANVDVIVFADKSYTMIGESQPRMKPSFDVRKNQDILLVEQHRGGSLTKYHSAVTITFSGTAPANAD